MGKILIIIGAIIIIIGLIYSYFGNIFSWFGNLPGDIKIEKENFRFYFPFASGVLLGILVSVIMWIVKYFTNKL